MNGNEEEDSSMNGVNEDEELDNQFETRINDIYNHISVIIANEKNKIKTKRDIIQKARNDFNQYKKIELEKLELKKKELKNLFQLKNNKKENDILDLNIGGTHSITTSRNTLIKYKNSALATLFTGEKELPKYNGKIFIDREGEPFINLINFLRTGKFPVLKNDIEESKFFSELEFWKIPLSDGKINSINFQFDPEYCSSNLILDNEFTVVKKNNLQHGIVFCKQNLDDYSPYIEFKINIETPLKGKGNLYIGLVDKSKSKPQLLSSKFWKDTPQSYYWNVWGTQLIKINEMGIQSGSIKGYGCQCEDFETYIGIKYEHISRSVSFYKNGINLGVAFRNVQSGLTPVLDIWFEKGTIFIKHNAVCEEKKFL